MPLAELSLRSLTAPAEQYWAFPAKYDLDPPYQRALVWTPVQRVNLIKSMLMGLPIGAIVVNFRGYTGETCYAVVDGKQRIETLRAFVGDEFTVPAHWFDPADLVEGVVGTEIVYSQLRGRPRRRLCDFGVATLRAEVSTVAQEAELYGLLNSGGTAHTDAELAKAIEVATS